jgi:outer membrane murein-binding lipoprotein Lpp
MDRREALAAAGVLGVAGLSGCLGYRAVDADTVTERKVRIARLEAQVREREAELSTLREQLSASRERVRRLEDRLDAPHVNAAHVVSDWRALGDVRERQASAVRAGTAATLAVNFSYPPRRPNRDETDWWNGEAAIEATVRTADTDADGGGEGESGGGSGSGSGSESGSGDGESDDAGAVRARERLVTRLFVEPDQRLVETALELPTADLSPGDYRVAVRVTDTVSGLASARVTTGLTVRER